LLSLNPKLEEFLKSVDNWLDCYSRVGVSYLAVNTGDVKVLYYYRVVLNAGLYPYSLNKFRHESNQLVCGITEIKFSREWFGSLFENARKGEVIIDGEKFLFALDPPQVENYTYNKTGALGIRSLQRIPGIDIHGSDLRNHVRELDMELMNWEVRAGSAAYDDVAELLTLLDFRRDLFSVSVPTIQIAALPPAVIASESSMNDGKATILLRVGKGTDRSKISLAYKVVSKEGPHRQSVDPAHIKWIEGSERFDGMAEVDTGHGAQMHVFLQYGGEAINHWWIRDPNKFLNPFLAAYECFDEGSEVLKKLLFKPKEDTIGFEVGVSVLLSILGLATSHLGIQERLQKGPDLVAYVPGVDAALVIECTTDILSKGDKLAKLLERTHALREKLQASGYENVFVYPVIVSFLPRERLSADLSVASQNQVSVVALEQLQKWFDQRVFGPNQRALFDEIVGLVPRQTNTPFQIVSDGV